MKAAVAAVALALIVGGCYASAQVRKQAANGFVAGRNRRPSIECRLHRPRLQEGSQILCPGRWRGAEFGDHPSNGGRAPGATDRPRSR